MLESSSGVLYAPTGVVNPLGVRPLPLPVPGVGISVGLLLMVTSRSFLSVSSSCGDYRDDISIGLLVSSESLRIPSHWNVGASGVRDREDGEAAPATSGDAGDGARELYLLLTIVLNS